MELSPQKKTSPKKHLFNMEIDMAILDRLNAISGVAYSNKSTVYNTYCLARKVLDLPGCFVECGVGAGAQIMAMQLASNGSSKTIYAFDSFEGIPMAGPNDDSQPGIGIPKHDRYAPISDRLVSSGITSHSDKNVKENFERFGVSLSNILFIKGWFQHTLFGFDTGPISLLRLDGDLYESTLICLEELYPKVVLGGVVIIDDYALEGCRKAVHDYFKELPEIIKVSDDISDGVVYFFKK